MKGVLTPLQRHPVEKGLGTSTVCHAVNGGGYASPVFPPTINTFLRRIAVRTDEVMYPEGHLNLFGILLYVLLQFLLLRIVTNF